MSGPEAPNLRSSRLSRVIFAAERPRRDCRSEGRCRAGIGGSRAFYRPLLGFRQACGAAPWPIRSRSMRITCAVLTPNSIGKKVEDNRCSARSMFATSKTCLQFKRRPRKLPNGLCGIMTE